VSGVRVRQSERLDDYQERQQRAAEELRREQRLRIAQKAGMAEIPRGELRRFGPYLERAATGELFHVSRGEVFDQGHDVASAYYHDAGGGLVFLQRPQGPQTRAEFEAQRAERERRRQMPPARLRR